MNTIGTLQESSLHAALKQWLAQPGDQFEVPLNGSIIDIVRGDLLIEIQTRNFTHIRPKLERLAQGGVHSLRLVYPIPLEKWIVRLDADGETLLSRRKSPARGRVETLFGELVALPHLVMLPQFSLEVLLTREEVVWRKAPGQWSRRARGEWRYHDRRLLDVVERRVLDSAEDFRALLPARLKQPFTNTALAARLHIPRVLSQRMTYCLRCMGVLEVTGRQGRAYLYRQR